MVLLTLGKTLQAFCSGVDFREDGCESGQRDEPSHHTLVISEKPPRCQRRDL